MDTKELNGWLADNDFIGYWARNLPEHTGSDFKARFGPRMWKWGAMARALELASDTIAGEDTFRRDIGYAHPDIRMGPIGGTTAHTFSIGVQYVKPGETPPAHRHTMAAMRFVIDGSDAGTVVDGEEFPMEPGDLITTPSMTWHDHYNRGAKPIMWLDIVDPQIMGFLSLIKAEIYSKVNQDVVRPVGMTAAESGAIRPIWLNTTKTQPPAYRYRWSETQRVLDMMAEEEGDPFDGLTVRYLNPLTGGATLPTLQCEMQMLRPGEATKSHRHSYTVAYYAFGGRGRSYVDDTVYEWEKGDVFLVPLWYAHRHENVSSEPAYLFTVSDRPLIESLGFYDEKAG